MPVTGKYALVQIGSVYLTTTGLVGGKPCKTEITGLDDLALDDSIQVTKALSGKPFLQTSTLLLGIKITIKLFDVPDSVYSSIITEIQTAVTALSTINLDISNSPYGDFSPTVTPDEKTVTHAFKFNGDTAREPVFSFLTT